LEAEMGSSLADEQAAVRSLFERLAARGTRPLPQTITGTWQFDIDDCGRWYVTVVDGSVSVSRDPRPAACFVSSSARNLVEVLEGRQNVVTAFLCGRVKARGDLALGLSFRHLLPVSQ
jgi:predicted lipid carrier protein YhbT